MNPESAREAFQAYQRMGADLERQGRVGEAAIAYSNAYDSAQALGRLQDALEASQKAAEMAERAGNPGHIARALNRLGQTHMDLNAPQRAIPVFEKAARLGKTARNPGAEVSSYLGLSRAYRRIGNPELARQSTARAVTVLESAIPQKELKMGRVKGGRRGSRGEGASPEGELWSLERHYANALLDLGWNDVALNRLEPARADFQKALESGERIEVPQVLAKAHQGLGKVAAERGEFQAAIDHLREALRLSQEPSLAGGTQGLLGHVYLNMANLPEAENHLRGAVATIEDMRSQLQSEQHRESFVEDKMGAYGGLIGVLFDQGKFAQAFDISERARARAFLDLLGNRVSLTRSGNAALVAEEKTLQEHIARLKARQALEEAEDESEETPPPRKPVTQQELDLAREAYQAFLQRVRQLDREQASLMTVEPLTLPQVQALLPEGSVLLEYFVTGQGKTLLWTVERDRVALVTLPLDRQQVTERVQRFRALIASRGEPEATQRMAQALFDELVRPGLQGRAPKELLIVPHDALHYLPFQALMSGPDRYLIQEAPLHYYSSASLMQFTRAKGQAGAPSLFALGNPDLQDPTLNLWYAEWEARTVAVLFPGALLLTRLAATKARSRDASPQYRILHFATHAELDEDDPLGSALRLTPSPTDDGRLEVQEIFGWHLHASLVVLSACETALGKLTRGDELTGLTRAFIYAGTPSVITTLWPVNDRAAFALMQAFYRHLKAGENKAEALRQAQLVTLAKYPHPYYWAAYELTGEAR
jgi:CHAT domain-containing protein